MTAGTGTDIGVVPVLDEVLDAADGPDHIACCRGSWEVAACGADVSGEPIVFFVDEICPPCMEVVRGKYEALKISPRKYGKVCFEDGSRCPRGKELDHLLQRILSRPE